VFEAVHGSAPDIAGKNLANPLALMRSAILMLHHLGMEQPVERLRRALRTVIVERGVKTRDLGGEATTSGFADAVVEELGRGG
jgi:isocitrate dehydrogenase (NAD+)